MREFCESCVSNFNGLQRKKTSKVEESLKRGECRCCPPYVKVHHIDCPLLQKKFCPVHGETRFAKTDSCMLITFRPNLKNDGFSLPIDTVLAERTCCAAVAAGKPAVLTTSDLQQYPRTKNIFSSKEVQTNCEDLKKTDSLRENNTKVKLTKPFLTGKSHRIKKLRKCFLSPCDSVAQTPNRGKIDGDADLNLKKGKNFSVLVESPGDGSLERTNNMKTVECYCLNPEISAFPGKQKISEIIQKNDGGNDYFYHTTMDDSARNFLLLAPYVFQSTLSSSEPNIKDVETTARKSVPQKFEPKESVPGRSKKPSDQRNGGSRIEFYEDSDEGNDADHDLSDSSRSVYLIPFILGPNEHDEESVADPDNFQENDFVPVSDEIFGDQNGEKQSFSTYSADPSITTLMTKEKGISVPSPGSPGKEREETFSNNTIRLYKQSPTASASALLEKSKKFKDTYTQMSPTEFMSSSRSNNSSDSENSFEEPTRDNLIQRTQSTDQINAKTKKEIEIQTRYENESDNKESIVTFVKAKRSENLGDEKEKKSVSVKYKTIVNLSRPPSSEKTSLISKKSNEGREIFVEKNDVLLELRESQNKPSTSLKLMETSVSVTAKVPQPGCYCGTIIQPVDASESYVIKHFPSLESSPSEENEIRKLRNKYSSDPHLYQRKNTDPDEAEECNCDKTGENRVCPLHKTDTRPDARRNEEPKASKENTPKSPANATKTNPSPAQPSQQPPTTPLSDLSELIKIIDQGFDRMTNEMRGFCECKQQAKVKQDVVVLIERAVMTDAVDIFETQDSVKSKREIHFTNPDMIMSNIVDSQSEADPNKVNIRLSVPTNKPLNSNDVIVCKLCASAIKKLTRDASTSTKAPEKNNSFITQAIEVSNSVAFKKILENSAPPVLKSSTTPDQKKAGSAVPTFNKHHCFDINDLYGAKPKPQTKPVPRPAPVGTISNDPKSGSTTPKTTTPRTIQKTVIKTRNCADLEADKLSSAKPSGNLSSGQRSGASSKIPTPSSQRPARPQTQTQAQRKYPRNFTAFPVRMSSLLLNEYFRRLQEEAMRRCQLKIIEKPTKTFENGDPFTKNLETESSNGMPENSDIEDFETEKTSFSLRPTKSETCSCQDGKLHRRCEEYRTKHYVSLPDSDEATARSSMPWKKVIKSDENLKKGSSFRSENSHGKKKNSALGKMREREMSSRIVGETFQDVIDSTTGNEEFPYESPRNGKSSNVFLCEFLNWCNSDCGQNHAINNRDRTRILSDFPFSNDDETFPQEFSDEDSSLSQKNDSNVE